MDRLQRGFSVQGVDDRRLGQVVRINVCCFEVETFEAGTTLHLAPEAIFNVDRSRVTLVCVNEEVRRYACRIHGLNGRRPSEASG